MVVLFDQSKTGAHISQNAAQRKGPCLVAAFLVTLPAIFAAYPLQSSADGNAPSQSSRGGRADIGIVSLYSIYVNPRVNRVPIVVAHAQRSITVLGIVKGIPYFAVTL